MTFAKTYKVDQAKFELDEACDEFYDTWGRRDIYARSYDMLQFLPDSTSSREKANACLEIAMNMLTCFDFPKAEKLSPKDVQVLFEQMKQLYKLKRKYLYYVTQGDS